MDWMDRFDDQEISDLEISEAIDFLESAVEDEKNPNLSGRLKWYTVRLYEKAINAVKDVAEAFHFVQNLDPDEFSDASALYSVKTKLEESTNSSAAVLLELARQQAEGFTKYHAMFEHCMERSADHADAILRIKSACRQWASGNQSANASRGAMEAISYVIAELERD
jgi:hypothetical protein